MSYTRQERFSELEGLIRLQAIAGTRPNTCDTIADIIDQLLEELYPLDGCTMDALTCERPDCCQTISDELYERLMNQDAQVPVTKLKMEPATLKDETKRPMSYEEFCKAVDEAAEFEVEYITLEEGMRRLQDFKGGRLARAGWDNGLNHEYVEYVPLVGPVKVYQTSSVKTDAPQGRPYFKNVIHTFEPTESDKKSTDWYFL